MFGAHWLAYGGGIHLKNNDFKEAVETIFERSELNNTFKLEEQGYSGSTRMYLVLQGWIKKEDFSGIDKAVKLLTDCLEKAAPYIKEATVYCDGENSWHRRFDIGNGFFKACQGTVVFDRNIFERPIPEIVCDQNKNYLIGQEPESGRWWVYNETDDFYIWVPQNVVNEFPADSDIQKGLEDLIYTDEVPYWLNMKQNWYQSIENNVMHPDNPEFGFNHEL